METQEMENQEEMEDQEEMETKYVTVLVGNNDNELMYWCSQEDDNNETMDTEELALDIYVIKMGIRTLAQMLAIKEFEMAGRS